MSVVVLLMLTSSKTGNSRDGETLRRQGKRPAVGLVGEEGAGRLGDGPPAVVAADTGHLIVYAHFGEVPCGNVSEVCLFTKAPRCPCSVMVLVRAEILPLVGCVRAFAVQVFYGLAQGGELEGGDSSTSAGMTGRDSELADFQP